MLDDKCFVFLNLLHCVSINFIKKRKKTLIEGEKVVEWMDNASCRRTKSHLRRLEIVCTETLHLLPHPLHFLFQRLPILQIHHLRLLITEALHLLPYLNQRLLKSTPRFTSSPIPLLILICLLIHYPLHHFFPSSPLLHHKYCLLIPLLLIYNQPRLVLVVPLLHFLTTCLFSYFSLRATLSYQ